MTIGLLLCSGISHAQTDLSNVLINSILFEKANELRYENPDSAIQLLELSRVSFINKSDTIGAIKALIGIAQIEGHRANYKASYDKLWRALFLADESQNEEMKVGIYGLIGRYYSFYKRRERALYYFGLSLGLNKELVERGILESSSLSDNYYAFCSTFRELNDVELGALYLDSCFLYYDPERTITDISYLKFEQAHILKEHRKYVEAIAVFEEILPWFEENNTGYRVLLYAYMGDSYRGLGNYLKSEENYLSSLRVSSNYKSHIDFSVLVHEKLADLYLQIGDHTKAYGSLRAAKELDQLFFDSRSENNRPLLEIQDEFRIQKENQRLLIQEQRLAQLEQEEQVSFLQKIILVVTLVSFVLVGFVYFKFLRSKYKAEKKLIRKKQELEIQKTQEIIQLKNRELAATTLKLIEKGEFLSDLQQKLSVSDTKLKITDVRRMIKASGVNNSKNWQEFEARFVSVNRHFYKKLNKKFPDLTQGDLKLCALVKLSFSSKDMSKLMGISVESVHTTRYRLRKKMNLTRDENLTEIIAGI